MAVGDLIRVTVNQTLQSSTVQNVLYYKIEIEDNSGDDVNALALQFIADVINPVWLNVVSEELSFDCISVQKVFPLPIGAVQEFNVSLAGLNIGESLPAMSSALIQKFNPTQGGVGKKGRVYLAGIREDDTSLGRTSVALAALLVLLANQFSGNLEVTPGGGEYEPVWAVRSSTTPFAITGFVEDLQWQALPRIATQRRRRTPIRSTSP